MYTTCDAQQVSKRMSVARYTQTVLTMHCHESPTPSERYDTIREAILTRAQKLTRVSLIYRTQPKTKKWKKERTKK